MKKQQFSKFWEALASSTSAKETISAFENKKGYGGKRTLERCAQAAEGFKESLQSQVIARKTGWSVKYVTKIRTWWDELVAQKLLESYKETDHKQKSYKETDHKQKMRELAQALQGKIELISIYSCFNPGWKTVRFLEVGTNTDGGKSFKLRMEDGGLEAHLWKGLREHLESSGFSDVLWGIDAWQNLLAEYVKASHRFFRIAKNELGGHVSIPDAWVERHEKRGYKSNYLAVACSDAIQIVMGKKPEGSGLGYWPQPLSPGSLWVLMRYNHGAIYVAADKAEADLMQNEHSALRLKLSRKKQAKKIAKLRRDLESTVEKTKNRLQVFVDMEQVPGHCDLCLPVENVPR